MQAAGWSLVWGCGLLGALLGEWVLLGWLGLGGTAALAAVSAVWLVGCLLPTLRRPKAPYPPHQAQRERLGLASPLATSSPAALKSSGAPSPSSPVLFRPLLAASAHLSSLTRHGSPAGSGGGSTPGRQSLDRSLVSACSGDPLVGLRRLASLSPPTSLHSSSAVRRLMDESALSFSLASSAAASPPSLNASASHYQCRSVEDELNLSARHGPANRSAKAGLPPSHSSPSLRRKRLSWSESRDSLFPSSSQSSLTNRSGSQSSLLRRSEHKATAKVLPPDLESYDLDEASLEEATVRLRAWLQATVLQPLVRELDLLGPELKKVGYELGSGSLEGLDAALNSAGLGAQASAVHAALSLSADQAALVKAIRRLAASPYLLRGSSAPAAPPSPAPSSPPPAALSDAAVAFHVLSAYLDSVLWPVPSGKPFSKAYVLPAPTTPPSESGQPAVALLWPSAGVHLRVQLRGGEEILDPGAGPESVLRGLVVFLAHLRRDHDGLLGGVSLGPHGLNLDQIFL